MLFIKVLDCYRDSKAKAKTNFHKKESPSKQKRLKLKKMKISDRINRIDRIRSNPVYPVNPVKRFD